MRPSAKNPTEQRTVAYPKVLRGCGVGALLGGVLFVTWGYIDTPGVSGGLALAVRVLSFVVPGLFLVGLASFVILGGSRFGALGWTGIVLALVGSVMGAVDGIADGDPVRAYYELRGWPLYLSVWLVPFLSGLTTVGIDAAMRKSLRGLGAVALVMGAFGWCYYLTDSGAVLQARSVHVGCGLMFSLAWVAWGVGVWARGARQ